MRVAGVRSLKALRTSGSASILFARGNHSLSKMLSGSLKDVDPEMFSIIENEKKRQVEWLNLIASENYTSQAVLDALGSVMQNKYSEGYPGARYYGGNEFIDQAETTCQKRALEVFNASSDKWGVNVQPHSGSPANFAVYTAVLGPHERMMALDLPHGGHLSHGYATPTRKVSAVSIYFECLPYRLNESTGYIDYDTIEKNAALYRPKLLVSGASAYSRHIDYKRLRKIADSVNAYLMIDMAHISGLVAAGVMPSPFEYADVVTTTTHKSLRGPRGAMIFYRKGVRKTSAKGENEMYALEDKINNAVFPGHQGGPHNHTISALAVALKQASTPEFKQYGKQVLSNCQELASTLSKKGCKLVSGGTDNHLVCIDFTTVGVTGAMVEKVLEKINIACNKNTVPGDKSAITPHGIRLGTPALTTRGMVESDVRQVGEFIVQAIDVTKKLQTSANSKKLNDVLAQIEKTDAGSRLSKLQKDVVAFSTQFPVPGITK